MNRDEFKKLTSIRRKDARILLIHGNYSGAYYLCGYVIECGLKACIAKRTKRYDFPPDRESLKNIYTHNLNNLVKGAKLEADLVKKMKSDPDFEVNWSIVNKWTENSRYDNVDEKKATDMYSAVTSTIHGVLKWIKQHW